jgi:hypothetical protein
LQLAEKYALCDQLRTIYQIKKLAAHARLFFRLFPKALAFGVGMSTSCNHQLLVNQPRLATTPKFSLMPIAVNGPVAGAPFLTA